VRVVDDHVTLGLLQGPDENLKKIKNKIISNAKKN
jgi:hypothetical protein